MPFSNDPIEKLAAGAQLHDQMNRMLVLKGALEFHNVWLTGQMVHDLDLPPDILNVLLVDQLPLGYRFAGELLSGLFVGAQMRHSELASAELFPDGVIGANVFHRTAQDGSYRGGLGAARGGRRRRGFGRGGGVVGRMAGGFGILCGVFRLLVGCGGSGGGVICGAAVGTTVPHRGAQKGKGGLKRAEGGLEREREG
ncbi:hypothetical protein RJ640_018196 [Escallonia rubra]|uniref:Uncharacterized protein n=1 Tax=Escallonia rubra TaxID=112253 RepID=A0AA88QV23_9ASTE|nr:hypothetical protein RJ640_018196 [Escallonia rubra]